MIGRRVASIALAFSLAAILVTHSGGAAHRRYTIAYITGGTTSGRIEALARGGRAAAKALGVRYVLAGTPGFGPDQELVAFYDAMIARHVDAVASDGYDPSLAPTLSKVRKAGILLISSGDDIAARRDLWVNASDPVTYGRALADALASQIDKTGEYAIVGQEGQYPVADAWEKVVEAYVRQAYPNMKLDGVITGTGAGDESEVTTLKNFMSGHPSLRGFIGVVPTEAQVAAEAITQAGRIGQVFSAGNGGESFGAPSTGFVRSGAAEFVFGGNPIELGYLTVWAANYLLTGHHFRPGAYEVGGPIGLVYYYAKHRELRLGQPLTITRTNVTLYANKF
jgi:rhamnose transport system substrate-binding protein